MLDARSYSNRLAQRGPLNTFVFFHGFGFSLPAGSARAFQRMVRALLFAVVACGTIVAAQTSQGNVSLPHHVPAQVLNGQAIRASHYDPDQKLRLVMSIKAPQMAAEEQFIREQQTKGSPNFHKFLTAEEW